MSTVSPTPASLHVGQRVHHSSFGPGRVTEAPTHGTLRVLFSSGLEPLVRADALMPVPGGFEPVYADATEVADYARQTVRQGFTVEEMALMPDAERVVWVTTTNDTPWLSIDQPASSSRSSSPLSPRPRRESVGAEPYR